MAGVVFSIKKGQLKSALYKRMSYKEDGSITCEEEGGSITLFSLL